MKCPSCKETMIALEYEAVEVDYCVGCHGVWLDAGELELLFGNRTLAAGFMTAGNPAKHAPGEMKRLCPECDAVMERECTDGAASVTYDFCKQSHGIFFDKGELHAVLQHGGTMPGGDEVSRWLGEMFPE